MSILFNKKRCAILCRNPALKSGESFTLADAVMIFKRMEVYANRSLLLSVRVFLKWNFSSAGVLLALRNDSKVSLHSETTRVAGKLILISDWSLWVAGRQIVLCLSLGHHCVCVCLL